ncbi:hypothetical protein C2G38_2042134 [Gigaspora rosea]|uniref:Uncharacterized protein n=1 Tax=Gigaspora rosea TaxID=44941 RepID=A0A397UP97_9GLOM|nr:hypothetical protein C2G38_2042134 [Gigaspora rosea]
MNLSGTLDRVSTGNVKTLYPFWNKHTEEISKKLWLPKNVGLHTSLSNEPLLRTEKDDDGKKMKTENDDENDNGKKIKTENDDKNDDVEGKKMKTRKIRMYPTLEEKEKLRKWIGTVR